MIRNDSDQLSQSKIDTSKFPVSFHVPNMDQSISKTSQSASFTPDSFGIKCIVKELKENLNFKLYKCHIWRLLWVRASAQCCK